MFLQYVIAAALLASGVHGSQRAQDRIRALFNDKGITKPGEMCYYRITSLLNEGFESQDLKAALRKVKTLGSSGPRRAPPTNSVNELTTRMNRLNLPRNDDTDEKTQPAVPRPKRAEVPPKAPASAVSPVSEANLRRMSLAQVKAHAKTLGVDKSWGSLDSRIKAILKKQCQLGLTEKSSSAPAVRVRIRKLSDFTSILDIPRNTGLKLYGRNSKTIVTGNTRMYALVFCQMQSEFEDLSHPRSQRPDQKPNGNGFYSWAELEAELKRRHPGLE